MYVFTKNSLQRRETRKYKWASAKGIQHNLLCTEQYTNLLMVTLSRHPLPPSQWAERDLVTAALQPLQGCCVYGWKRRKYHLVRNIGRLGKCKVYVTALYAAGLNKMFVPVYKKQPQCNTRQNKVTKQIILKLGWSATNHNITLMKTITA